MPCDFEQIPEDGLYYRQRRIANATFQIETVYEDALSETRDICAVKLCVTIATLAPKCLTLSLSDLTYQALHQAVPLLSVPNHAARALLNSFLTDSVIAFLQGDAAGKGNIGKYLRENGCHRIPDGTWCAVEGTEVIGSSLPFLTNPHVRQFQIASTHVAAPICHLLHYLQGQPSVLLLLVSYAYCSLIRSAILDAGIDFHAVAWLFGGQGFGKPTAAKRIAGFIIPQGNASALPALFYDCSSLTSAVRES